LTSRPDPNRADNKLRRKLFRFRVQYIYENSEETAWSLWSNLALPSQSEFISGSNWPDSSADNRLDVTFDTGPNVVKKINLAVQIYSENTGGAETEFGLFYQLDKSDPNVVISDNSTFTYQFFGNVSTKPISNASKNYDRLPLTAKCQTAIENTRLTYSNFREGYDKIEIDIRTDYSLNEIDWIAGDGPAIDGTFSDVTNEFILRSDYDVTTFPFQKGMTFSFGNVDFGSASYSLTQEDISNALAEATVQDQNIYIFQVMGDAISDQLGLASGTATGGAFYEYTTVFAGTGNWSFTLNTNRQTLATPSLKVGATHQFGIVYGDRAQRDGTVLTNDYLNVFIPWYSDVDTSDFTDPINRFFLFV